jgi:hypothetical protein
MMLVLKYHLTEAEYFDYNYYTSWSSPDKKKYRLRYYFRVLILYAAIAGLYIYSNRNTQPIINVVIFSLIAIAYFLLVPTIIRGSIRKRVRDILAQPENKHILDETEVILSETGITDKDKSSESKYSWEAIVRKSETSACYYLYTNSYHAIVIPKRAVTDPKERQELENMLDRFLSLSSEFPT